MNTIKLYIKEKYLAAKIAIVKAWLAIDNFIEEVDEWMALQMIAPELFNQKIHEKIEYLKSKKL